MGFRDLLLYIGALSVSGSISELADLVVLRGIVRKLGFVKNACRDCCCLWLYDHRLTAWYYMLLQPLHA